MTSETENASTLSELLEATAAHRPRAAAFLFLGTDGAECARLDYRELWQRSCAFASSVGRSAEPGGVAVLALHTSPEAVVAFFGCVLAGLLPAMLPPPRHGRDRKAFDRLARVAAETGARRVFVEDHALAAASTLPHGCQALDVRAASHTSDDFRPPRISGHDPAYLQFTSGSTARPKGVMLTHENVLSNLELLKRVFGHGPELKTVSWLPLYHDMGLVGHVLHPLYVGGTSVLAPPAFFARDPLDWLRAIARYDAASSGAPPFAYEAAAERAHGLEVDFDLGRWRDAYVGAEPVSPETLERFARAFAPRGFRREAFFPCYGLSEATLFVAGQREVRAKEATASGGAARHVLGYACAPCGPDVRVVDPGSFKEVSDTETGEIWVGGSSVAREYLCDAEASRRTFLRADFGAGEFTYVRTGDLGFKEGGRLYISGRLKDLVIVRGVKHHPEEIEATARASHELLRPGVAACFSVEGRATEEPLVVLEVKLGTERADPSELCDAVRDAVAHDHGINLAAVILVRRGTLPRTSSGKVSRSSCRAAYLRNSLREVSAWGGFAHDSSGDTTGHAANVNASNERRAATAKARAETSEPIAVVGLACRFPGAEGGPEEFWSALAAGTEGIREVPRERWNADLFYDPRPAVPGKMNTRWGGFLEGIELFDAEFFGIAPHEAAEIDPQQRLLLEVAWRAFERAGFPAERLAGSDTGVFVGISTTDYIQLQIKLKPGLELYNAYTGLGNANSVAANRLSFAFDLRGPSIAVDTACSSSLTAIHLAVQSLRRGECASALAGGVNAILSPGTTVTLSQFNMMARDGRCKVFDSRADGYVRSEGCGLVVLKRRSDALRDGDRVLAYIRGSAIGQNGRGPYGITTPSPDAQRRVVEDALADAGCAPEEVTFVEAHGTGTSIGDPAEVEQLKRVYGGDSPAGRCHLGAVKANVGHLEAAAGVAGVIKLILALQRREIPPQIHLRQLNPRINLEDSRLRIPRARTPWTPAAGSRRVGAVSSFGFGGANAHAILEEPEASEAEETAGDAGPSLFPLSAKTEAALREQARSLAGYLEKSAEHSLGSLCYTQSVRRTHFSRRAAFVADTREELRAALEAYAHGAPTRRADGEARADGGAALLFSGQGSQYAGMGRELYENFQTFRREFDLCAAVFDEEHGRAGALRSITFSEEGASLDSTLYQQPALFALGYALARLWMSLGVRPSALAGHSLGEYAAACLAGCFTPEEGMRLVSGRARLMNSIAEAGAMVAVAASEAELIRLLREDEMFGGLSVAAVNAPDGVVLSGPAGAVEAALEALAHRSVAARRLRTSHAFHSALMDGILEEFESLAASVSFRAPSIPLVSSLTGELLTEAPDAVYLRRHLRSCVRFRETVGTLERIGARTYLEIGPGTTLLSLVSRCHAEPRAALLPSLARGEETRTLLQTAARLYASGTNLRWQELHPPRGVRYMPDLPGHPFQRQRHWFTTEEAYEAARASTHPAEASAAAAAALTSWEAMPESSLQSPRLDRLGRCLYELRWIRKDLPASAALETAAAHERRDEARAWLIVGDGGGLAHTLAARLGRSGCRVFRVSHAEASRAGDNSGHKGERATGAKQFDVRTGCDAGAYEEILRRIEGERERSRDPRLNLLYLNGLGCAAPAETSMRSLEMDQRLHGPGDLAALTQAVVGAGLRSRLWIVTENSQPVDPEEDCGRAEQAGKGQVSPHVGGRPPHVAQALNVAQAPLWGFAHTLFLEQPEMRGGLVDLSSGDGREAQAAQLLAQIVAGDGETQAAFRDGARYAPRIVDAHKRVRQERVALRRDGAYLVTGGLGGLGLECARWMAERGAGHIILLGRRPLPERERWDELRRESEDWRRVEGVRAVERAGASVEVHATDVADYERVAEIIRGANAGGRSLRGVLHAAGVNWFSKVAVLERERLLETLKIKVSAAWHLHELTRDEGMDFFILFSSVSALWGSVELAHYTAANQFLDALAYQRRGEGLHALAVDWGPWAEVGMSARAEEVRLLTGLGFRLLEPARAVAALEALLAADLTRAVVTDLDWTRFRSFIDFSASPALFERVSAARPSSSGAPTQAARAAANPDDDSLKTAPPEEAHARIVSLVGRHLSSVMLLDPERPLDVNERFNLMGMDSLMAIAFALRLESVAGTKLPTALAYNYPTVLDLADHLFELIRGQQPPARDGSSRADRGGNELLRADGNGHRPASTRTEPSGARLWFPSLNGSTSAPLRLFCFPYAGGGASVYRRWVGAPLLWAEVVPVQLPGREERAGEPQASELEALARTLADAFGELDAAPFAFFGHSMGAMLSFEVARELRRRGAKGPQRLILSACGAPEAQRGKLIHELPDEEFRQRLAESFETPAEVFADERVWQSLLPALRSDICLLEKYRPSAGPTLDAPLSVFGGAEDAGVPRERLLAWGAHTTGDFSLRIFRGSHMFVRGREAEVLEAVRAELEEGGGHAR